MKGHREDQSLDDLLLEALSLPEDARLSYLDSLEASDPAIGYQLRQLVDSYQQFDAKMLGHDLGGAVHMALGESLLFDDLADTVDKPCDGEGPRFIGPYEIFEELGRGGHATVYRARQSYPSRELALKLLPNRGADEALLARFHREYQALARMKHPNIAVIYDAGLTLKGDAWMAMELLEHGTITDYCKNHDLSLKARLGLLMQLLSGLIHAHQNAVVHRDLKPANLLMTETDGKPCVKIIDFGLAKGMGGSLAGDALKTGFGDILGTPAYMSPEQMVFGEPPGADIRSDIFSLGLIAYEMVTGQHAYDLSGLQGAPLDELFGYLRTHQPDRNLVDGGKRLDRDLSYILTKAMARDINQRYQSAHLMKNDLALYLAGEPVVTETDSSLVRLAKFARRHKKTVSLVALVMFALLAGLTQAIIGKRQAEHGRRVAEDALTFMEHFMGASDPSHGDRRVTLLGALESAELALKTQNPDPQVALRIRLSLGHTFFGNGMYPQAEAQLQRAISLASSLGEQEQAMAAEHLLGRVLRRRGDLKEALACFQKVAQYRQAKLGSTDRQTLEVSSDLGELWVEQGRVDEAIDLLQQTLVSQTSLLGNDHPESLRTQVALANGLYRKRDWPAARELYQRALDNQTGVLGADHPETLACAHNLGWCLMRTGELTRAEALLRDIHSRRMEKLGQAHNLTLSTGYALAVCLDRNKQSRGEAEALLVAQIDTWSKSPTFPDTLALVFHKLGLILRKQQRWTEAIETYHQHLAQRRQLGLEEDEGTLKSMLNLADLVMKHGDLDQALSLLHSRQEHLLGSDFKSRMLGLATLGEAYERLACLSNAQHYYCVALETGVNHLPESSLTQNCDQLYQTFNHKHREQLSTHLCRYCWAVAGD